ncbi:MAG: hypothetical protein OXN90_11495 [Gemmatimonadota bacterium]|nr:hypothetical protein [Gemmatimonadota bacterium]
MSYYRPLLVASAIVFCFAVPTQANAYTSVSWIRVLEGGGVEVTLKNIETTIFGFKTTIDEASYAVGAGCIPIPANLVVEGKQFVVKLSKWQKKESLSWVDVDGTRQGGTQLCGLDAPGPGEYRWVVEISLDGTLHKYASRNTWIVAGEEKEEEKEEEKSTVVEAKSWGAIKSRFH